MTYDPLVTHFRDPHDTPATLMTPLRVSWHPCDTRAADTYDSYDTHTYDICSVAIFAHVRNDRCVHTSSLLSDMNARSDEWLRLHRVDGGARSVFLALSDEAQEAIRRKGGLGFKNTSMVLMSRIRAHRSWVDKTLKQCNICTIRFWNVPGDGSSSDYAGYYCHACTIRRDRSIYQSRLAMLARSPSPWHLNTDEIVTFGAGSLHPLAIQRVHRRAAIYVV